MKRDVKRIIKQGKDIGKLKTVLALLASTDSIHEKYQDHSLKGDLRGYRECHIEPDWLLIYQINKDELVLFATRTGTYAELFDE